MFTTFVTILVIVLMVKLASWIVSNCGGCLFFTFMTFVVGPVVLLLCILL